MEKVSPARRNTSLALLIKFVSAASVPGLALKKKKKKNLPWFDNHISLGLKPRDVQRSYSFVVVISDRVPVQL